MQSSKRPNFFIVGAPKCGTSSLYTYLRQHPDVFMPEIKEPNFFAVDLGFPVERDLAGYLALFAEARDEKRLGEASTWHLFSPAAPTKIKEFCPAAKIICMLRNPVDMIYSLHGQSVFSGHEDILDFAAALDAEADRKQGRRLPKHAIGVKGRFYRDVAMYSEQVQRYFDVFGRANVQVIIFDDFKRDTARIYRETCEFLGIDASFQPTFEVANPHTRRRSMALRNLIWFLWSEPVRRLRKSVLPPALQRFGKRMAAGIESLNTKSEKRPPLDPALRARLQEEFAPDVERLSEMLGRDLAGLWR
jgi:hypothetical protein